LQIISGNTGITAFNHSSLEILFTVVVVAFVGLGVVVLGANVSSAYAEEIKEQARTVDPIIKSLAIVVSLLGDVLLYSRTNSKYLLKIRRLIPMNDQKLFEMIKK
jgi:hypothetical protein